MKKYIQYALAAVSILGLVSLALAQDATSTPPEPTVAPHQLFKPEELNINPEGKFLAHGMIVQSIGNNSFVGKVWGTSWTINIMNASELKFLLQNGSGVSQTTLPSALKTGDEVGVSGWVDESHELTVNGQVVRDYSLGDMEEFKNRETESENEQGNNNKNAGENENTSGKEGGQNNGQQGENEGENGQTSSGSSVDNQKAISDIQQQIQTILEQIKLLQNQAK